MIHFSGHFKGASTFLTPKLSLEMANKVIVPQKINYSMSRIFLNSGTLIVTYSVFHRLFIVQRITNNAT